MFCLETRPPQRRAGPTALPRRSKKPPARPCRRNSFPREVECARQAGAGRRALPRPKSELGLTRREQRRRNRRNVARLELMGRERTRGAYQSHVCARVKDRLPRPDKHCGPSAVARLATKFRKYLPGVRTYFSRGDVCWESTGQKSAEF